MTPVGIWVAANGSMDLTPWTLFLIIFLWSPPHFWALALYFKEDYIKVDFPMLPVVKGEKITLKYIFIFTVFLFIASLTPILFGAGYFYLAIAIAMGFMFLARSYQSLRQPNQQRIYRLFTFSIWYLFVIFTALIVDNLFLI